MTTSTKLGRPKGSKKENTLNKILPAARKLFASKGYDQTTFKAVGSELGISHAALYAYFDSKKSLYLATLKDTQDLLIPHYIAAFEQQTTLQNRLTAILKATAAEHDKDSSITGLLAAVPIEVRRHAELYEALVINSANDLMAVLEAMVIEAKQNNEIIIDAPAADLVTALFGGGVGVALFQYGLQREELAPAMDVYIKLLEGQLFNHQA